MHKQYYTTGRLCSQNDRLTPADVLRRLRVLRLLDIEPPRALPAHVRHTGVQQ
jgi:hypothetical protein